jgi:hypothetical protein
MRVFRLGGQKAQTHLEHIYNCQIGACHLRHGVSGPEVDNSSGPLSAYTWARTNRGSELRKERAGAARDFGLRTLI